MTKYAGWRDTDLETKLKQSIKVISEKKFQSEVCKIATLYGWTFYHTWNSMHSAAGFPDLVLVRPPKIIFAELKTEEGEVTKAQDKWLTLLDSCEGVSAYLWRPNQIESIVKLLSL